MAHETRVPFFDNPTVDLNPGLVDCPPREARGFNFRPCDSPQNGAHETGIPWDSVPSTHTPRVRGGLPFRSSMTCEAYPYPRLLSEASGEPKTHAATCSLKKKNKNKEQATRSLAGGARTKTQKHEPHKNSRNLAGGATPKKTKHEPPLNKKKRKTTQVISPKACGALFSARTTPQPSQNLVEPWCNPRGTLPQGSPGPPRSLG